MKGSSTQTSLPVGPELLEYSRTISRAGEDEFLREIEEMGKAHPQAIMVSDKGEVKLLQLLCHMLNAKLVIEVGVFIGYTTLAVAQKLPAEGKVFALDINREYTSVGEPVWEKAGQAHKIDLRIAPALDSMNGLMETHKGEIDLIYIDADKTNYPKYFDLSKSLIRVGGLIVVDNTLWSGKVVKDEVDENDVCTKTLKALNEEIRNLDETEFCIVNLPFADGMTLVLRLK